MVTLVFREGCIKFTFKKMGDFFGGSWRCFRSNRPGQAEEGEADVEKADLIAKDIGDHQLADEVRYSELAMWISDIYIYRYESMTFLKGKNEQSMTSNIKKDMKMKKK